MNKKWMEKIGKIVPAYAVIPLVMMLAANGIAYFGTRLWTTNLHHYSMKIWLDDCIQLQTIFVYPYILAYVQWIVGFILIARESREVCDRFLYGEIIAKLLCMLCFIFYPTTIVRPEITGGHLADILTRVVYQADAADNLFPSIHCLESYICLRGALVLKKTPRWYVGVSVVCTVLVFLSTVYLKQHVAVDMLGAVVAAELGLLIMKYIMKRTKEK